jgi:putative SOS response-associated peptidase YedK
MTTAANGFMQEIHDRMPVILARSDESAWLDPDIHEKNALRNLLKPRPSEWLNAVEVSTLVNSSKNNSRDILQPYTAKAAASSRSLFDP